MVLPKRLEINIPPAVTAVAEAAVGRDVVMRAVASAVLQADALENALIAALPLGPQSAAGGVSLPASFQGELQVSLVASMMPGCCKMVLGSTRAKALLASSHSRRLCTYCATLHEQTACTTWCVAAAKACSASHTQAIYASYLDTIKTRATTTACMHTFPPPPPPLHTVPYLCSKRGSEGFSGGLAGMLKPV